MTKHVEQVEKERRSKVDQRFFDTPSGDVEWVGGRMLKLTDRNAGLYVVGEHPLIVCEVW